MLLPKQQDTIELDEKSTPISNWLPIVNTIDLKRLGHKIRFLRQGRGWTLADLAQRSGVSKAYISDLENGVAGKPNIQYVFSIAKALSTTLDRLLDDAVRSEIKEQEKRGTDPLPQGLAELQQELHLSDDDVQKLATVSFRGHRPRDKEGWRYLLETLRMLGQRRPGK
ncbi:MAG: helix-turn-helix transcriptional regulator [Bryobacteraceae bacterium]|nr:helix-turn-helix transcriptional regulator [Bryobacteraceae bacterium]